MRRANRKTRSVKLAVIITAFVTAFVLIGGFFLYQKFFEPVVKPPEAATRPVKKPTQTNLQTIYPTLYVTGSSGETTSNMTPMVKQIAAAGDNPAKESLTIIVATRHDYKLTVTGQLEPGNEFPAIVVGMDKGTNNHLIYQYSLRVVMKYLAEHYKVPWCNMLGYSSAGGGVLRYLMAYGQEQDLPPVKKFLALDGEFNREIGYQAGENLASILAQGPTKQSADYVYFAQHYRNLPTSTQVALLECNYKNSGVTDGSIPYADAFSVYHLLKKNGNHVSRYIYPGQESHGWIWRNPLAVNYIEKFFYQSY